MYAVPLITRAGCDAGYDTLQYPQEEQRRAATEVLEGAESSSRRSHLIQERPLSFLCEAEHMLRCIQIAMLI